MLRVRDGAYRAARAQLGERRRAAAPHPRLRLYRYLLPWDQRAFWATTVGSEIAGAVPIVGDLVLVLLRVGWDVGGLTLARFYALHVLILPLATVTPDGPALVMVRRLHRPGAVRKP
jgi:quinol-cytochrome oxidoreductase complex cytochrome b subunit